MNYPELIEWAKTAPTSGWDFSALFGDRMQESEPSWRYPNMVRTHMHSGRRMLDMGTGGGELLLSLRPLPEFTVATEGYGPNVPVAREALRPAGVSVVQIPEDEEAPLPFADGSFDLIINRHEAYVPSEIVRVLRPGGVFVTQQVGGRDLCELNEALGGTAHEFGDWDLGVAHAQLVQAGMNILECREEMLPGLFRDIGAVALFLRIAPWHIPDFDLDVNETSLRALHKRIQKDGHFPVRHHRFVIRASKPKPADAAHSQ
ncbi:MAG TPA: class I SAM-dependent methyltransferase [Candidatus Stackebrandtia faecavium]|nr:class I SAM-dependent methyltransferase [Candidatus Stackebrandtia faecavium]